MSRRTRVEVVPLLTAVAVLLGCASSGPSPKSPQAVTLYEEVSWAKLFNPAFAQDLTGRAVQFSGMYLGPAASVMHMASGSSPWKDMVCIGLAPEGAQLETGLDPDQYEDEQWGIYLPKDRSESAFALKRGAIVTVYGRPSLYAGNAVISGSSGTVQLIVITVDRMEESK